MPSSQPIMKTIGYSRPLALWQRHQRHEALVVAARVGVGHERDLLEEHVERVARLGRGGVELARHLHELLQVLQAALRLDRPLGLERLDVAGLLQQRLQEVALPARLPPRARAAASSWP
jgi:hypothetical protein